jgi:hypothetical protein
MSSSEARRDDHALPAVRRRLAKPRILRCSLHESGDLTVQLIFAGPTLVLLTYVVAFAMTPGDRASADYPRPPRKSCDGRSADRFGHEFG